MSPCGVGWACPHRWPSWGDASAPSLPFDAPGALPRSGRQECEGAEGKSGSARGWTGSSGRAAPAGAVDLQDYGEPTLVRGLRRLVRGWVEYDQPLSPGQVKAYGLLVAKYF